MGDGHDAVGVLESGLHDVHVLAADGVVQAEGLRVLGRDLQGPQLGHGAPPLVGHVVDDKDAAGVGHLAVVTIVRLQGGSAQPVGRGWEEHVQMRVPNMCDT